MTKELSTKYNPQAIEAGKYEEWLERGVFKPSEDPEAEPYSIVIPPPNVTGKLHLGHAWDVTLQDMIIHAGLCRVLVAWDGPGGHGHPSQGRRKITWPRPVSL